MFIINSYHKFFSENVNISKKIVYYIRYVDDTLLLVDGNVDDVMNIFTKFNDLHNKIKFTYELEKDHTINFLDLTITKEAGMHKFGIYRKKTFSDSIINFHSNHPHQHKNAFFNFAFNRLFSIPLSQNERADERNIIYSIAKANDYPVSYVDKIYARIANKFSEKRLQTIQIQDSNSSISNKFICLPYYGSMSMKIAHIFKKCHMKVAFSTSCNLAHILNHKIDTNCFTQESGVYKICCPDCGACYVGQTGRKLEARFKEHIAVDRKDAGEKSNFAAHLIENRHNKPTIKSNMELLQRAPKGSFMDLWEELEIFRHQHLPDVHLLNEQVLVKNTHFWELFIDHLGHNSRH